MKINAILTLVSTLLLTGCSYTHMKDGGSATPLRGASIGFATVYQKVFQPNCVGCHSGNHAPSLTNYTEIKNQLENVRIQTIEKQRMPKRGPLVDEEMNLLKQWIAEGAPEFEANPTPTPSPQVGEKPEIKYSELVTKVLRGKCFNCHYKENPEKISDLDDYNTFVGTIGTSYFVSVINPAMPPPPKGLAEGVPNPNQLSRSEKELLSNWIIDGMLP